MANNFVSRGQIYVCQACGKMSTNLYGIRKGDEKVSKGWDESCMLNAVLCHEDKLIIVNGRVKSIERGGLVKEESTPTNSLIED